MARSGDGFGAVAGTADSSCLASLARRNDKECWVSESAAQYTWAAGEAAVPA